MNNNTRPLTYMSLGLLLVAILVPFIIVALGRNDIAIDFSIVAALLSALLWVFSQPERAIRIMGALSPSKPVGRFLIFGLGLVVLFGALRHLGF